MLSKTAFEYFKFNKFSRAAIFPGDFNHILPVTDIHIKNLFAFSYFDLNADACSFVPDYGSCMFFYIWKISRLKFV